MSIGEKIREYRKKRNLTQQELALKANISRSYLADVEKNRYNPSIETLKAIAKSLDISISEILSEENGNNCIFVKEDSTTYNTGEFKTAEDAIKFILKQPTIMGYGGFDINKMREEEIIEFANELLRQLEILSYKYKR